MFSRCFCKRVGTLINKIPTTTLKIVVGWTNKKKALENLKKNHRRNGLNVYTTCDLWCASGRCLFWFSCIERECVCLALAVVVVVRQYFPSINTFRCLAYSGCVCVCGLCMAFDATWMLCRRIANLPNESTVWESAKTQSGERPSDDDDDVDGEGNNNTDENFILQYLREYLNGPPIYAVSAYGSQHSCVCVSAHSNIVASRWNSLMTEKSRSEWKSIHISPSICTHIYSRLRSATAHKSNDRDHKKQRKKTKPCQPSKFICIGMYVNCAGTTFCLCFTLSAQFASIFLSCFRLPLLLSSVVLLCGGYFLFISLCLILHLAEADFVHEIFAGSSIGVSCFATLRL